MPERKASMSNNVYVRLIGRPFFETMGLLCLCIVGLLVSGGCGQEQRSVDLYVDAIMLKELNENEKAVEKLNSAVRLNKDFSLAYSYLIPKDDLLASSSRVSVGFRL